MSHIRWVVNIQRVPMAPFTPVVRVKLLFIDIPTISLHRLWGIYTPTIPGLTVPTTTTRKLNQYEYTPTTTQQPQCLETTILKTGETLQVSATVSNGVGLPVIPQTGLLGAAL
jgi:hypothetical protein